MRRENAPAHAKVPASAHGARWYAAPRGTKAKRAGCDVFGCAIPPTLYPAPYMHQILHKGKKIPCLVMHDPIHKQAILSVNLKKTLKTSESVNKNSSTGLYFATRGAREMNDNRRRGCMLSRMHMILVCDHLEPAMQTLCAGCFAQGLFRHV